MITFLDIEWTQSTQDIVQGFDNSMQSPVVPAATQPQVGNS
jgi:hypothetical protein